jgi:hypothetical protein
LIALLGFDKSPLGATNQNGVGEVVFDTQNECID